jgi:hypothetical protein
MIKLMTIEQINNAKIPIIVFDKKLENLNDKVLFPEKLAMANEILKKIGLPKKKKAILTINNILRGINIPAGNHKIEFHFAPLM